MTVVLLPQIPPEVLWLAKGRQATPKNNPADSDSYRNAELRSITESPGFIRGFLLCCSFQLFFL